MHSNELKVDHKIMRDMISKTTNFYHKKVSKILFRICKCRSWSNLKPNVFANS